MAQAAGVALDDTVVEPMLKMLLNARADANSVNEETRTVLDCSDSASQLNHHLNTTIAICGTMIFALESVMK